MPRFVILYTVTETRVERSDSHNALPESHLPPVLPADSPVPLQVPSHEQKHVTLDASQGT